MADPEPEQSPLTNSQVKKAGSALRHAYPDGDVTSASTELELAWAWSALSRFRVSHVGPRRTLMEALQPVSQAHSGRLTSRIKRERRIVSKLARTTSALNTLQDVAGVRIVVSSLDELRAVVDEIRMLDLEEARFYDYVSVPERQLFSGTDGAPKVSGYRGIHIVHRIDGRLVETQVRTATQHAWATAVERAEQATQQPLKVGEGTPALVDYFRMLAEKYALEERGQVPSAEMLAEFELLWEQALPHYRELGEPS